jgi:riboflavin-specific deaminase-like protein
MPQVIVSTTTTIDGYLDDTSDRRLILSSDEDLYEIHKIRARVGAILIGAETLRKDNPRLDIRYAEIQPEIPPVRIVVTNSGTFDPTSRFFSEGSAGKLVFCGPDTPSQIMTQLSTVATVIACSKKITAASILSYLSTIGIRDLLVEGGAIIQEMFFAEGCVDVLRLGNAPLLLGRNGGAHFLSGGKISPSTLNTLSVQKLGSTSVTWYQVKSDAEFLRRTAGNGGTIILNKYGVEIFAPCGDLSSGRSSPEMALMKAQELNVDTQGATLFTSLDSCFQSGTTLESFCSVLVKGGISRIVAPAQESSESMTDALGQLKRLGITVAQCDISDLTQIPVMNGMNSG